MRSRGANIFNRLQQIVISLGSFIIFFNRQCNSSNSKQKWFEVRKEDSESENSAAWKPFKDVVKLKFWIALPPKKVKTWKIEQALGRWTDLQMRENQKTLTVPAPIFFVVSLSLTHIASHKNCFAFSTKTHSMLFICCSFLLFMLLRALFPFRRWRLLRVFLSGLRESIANLPAIDAIFHTEVEAKKGARRRKCRERKLRKPPTWMCLLLELYKIF